ncbi:hypothetical protein AGMMS50212_07170 [Spirochaetia bacterium]|nr:hypothetical protein AGMMS50212_07170 [Spirochaetia bacterium]
MKIKMLIIFGLFSLLFSTALFAGGGPAVDIDDESRQKALDAISKRSNAKTGIEGAASRAADALIEKLSDNTVVAVLSISSRNRENSTFVMDEIEFHLVEWGSFKVVDRKTLDKIRDEQNFQLSGDVDDDSAVSIGKILGANVVITGSISGSGTNQRLTVKALDVQSAQIITMAREAF